MSASCQSLWLHGSAEDRTSHVKRRKRGGFPASLRWIRTKCPGGSLATFSRIVWGDGMKRNVKNSFRASADISPTGNPASTAALSSEENQVIPPREPTYSGLTPTGSRATASSLLRSSKSASAKIPFNLPNNASPHSSQPCTSTSVSHSVANTWPCLSRAERSDRWL